MKNEAAAVAKRYAELNEDPRASFLPTLAICYPIATRAAITVCPAYRELGRSLFLVENCDGKSNLIAQFFDAAP